MSIDLYYHLASSPCRAVIMAAKLIGVDLNLKFIDITKGEQMKPEFLKLNPQHTVPFLVDGDLHLSESRAIITYLINKYGESDSLYPKDPEKRAVVEERLYFDIGALFQPAADYFRTCVLGDAPLDEEKYQQITKNCPFLEKYLEESKFVAGDNLTVADISIVTNIANYHIVGIDLSKYPNILRWFALCKEVIPDYDEINHKGALQFKGFWDFLMAKKQNK